MASFDYDVIVVSSGFGGSVAALRAVEKGYSLGVLEAGRRWPDEELPRPRPPTGRSCGPDDLGGDRR
jgi:cholesterol oxidase